MRKGSQAELDIFFNNLKTLRLKSGMGQRDFAIKELDMKPTTYANYERGEREPKLETWKMIAKKLNVSVPYLQGLTDDPQGDFKLDYSRFKKMGDGLGGIDVREDDDKVSALYDELVAYLSDTGGSRNRVIQLLDEAKRDAEKFEREQLQQAHEK